MLGVVQWKEKCPYMKLLTTNYGDIFENWVMISAKIDCWGTTRQVLLISSILCRGEISLIAQSHWNKNRTFGD